MSPLFKHFTPIALPHRVADRFKFLKRRRVEAIVFLLVMCGFFGYLGHVMGASNLLNSIMKTAFDKLTNTVLYIMGITVLSGALAKLCVEFGALRLLELLLKPLVRPLYNLPSVAALAPLMAFFSDNPATISLARDKTFRSYLTERELVSLPNFGTSFGMGLIVITYMSSQGFFSGAMVGLLGAALGGIVATRLMQHLVRKSIPKPSPEELAQIRAAHTNEGIGFQSRGNVFDRFLSAILDGGKSGVDLGLAIIPGVLIISTFVTLITFGPIDPQVGYQGLAGEGVPILTHGAQKISSVFRLLFGFEHPELIAFPITSLGSVGAALAVVPRFVNQGILGGNEVAVFTAIGMCWSGFLSTYTAIFDALEHRSLTSKAILAQMVGGISAGVLAHLLWLLLQCL